MGIWKGRIGELEEIARWARIDVMTMIYEARDGYPAPALPALLLPPDVKRT